MRDPASHRPAHPARQRIGVAVHRPFAIAQEADQIAGGGETDPQHLGVLGGEGQGIGQLRIKAALDAQLGQIRFAGKGRGIAVGKGPVGARHRDLIPRPVVGDGGEQPRTFGSGRFVGASALPPLRPALDRQRGGAGGHVREAHAHRPADRRDRRRKSLFAGLLLQIALPAADQADMAVADGDGLAIAAIGHVIDQHAGGPADIHRLGDGEGGGIFHPALGVARCQGDIVDLGVAGAGGIQRAGKAALQQLIAAGHRRLLLDGEAGDFRPGRTRHRGGAKTRQQSHRAFHCPPSLFWREHSGISPGWRIPPRSMSPVRQRHSPPDAPLSRCREWATW